MKTIVIDVQLAPGSPRGFDIFAPGIKLEESNIGSYKDPDGGFRNTGMFLKEFPELKQIIKPVLAQLVIKVPREEGHYWVNAGSSGTPIWSIKFWDGEVFWDFSGRRVPENAYLEIDETKIEKVPNE